ncbi:hypothetical protein ACFQX7_16940 [Luedemannella flava]
MREVWYTAGPSPDHVVDITDTYDTKLAALRAHVSQTSHVDLDAILRHRLAETATAGGLGAGRLAEAFTVLRTE